MKFIEILNKLEEKIGLTKNILLPMFFVSLVFILGTAVSITANSFLYHANCGSHLVKARSALTIEESAKELRIVIDYLEKMEIISGNTGVLYQTSSEDIGLWYKSLVFSLGIMDNVIKTNSQEKKDIALFNMYKGVGGLDIGSTPKSIGDYPPPRHAFLIIISSFLVLIMSVLFMVKADGKR